MARAAIVMDIAELAKPHARAMIEVLVAIANDKDTSTAARVTAATSLLDRGYGRPAQTLEHTGPAGQNIKHDVIITIVRPDDQLGDKP